MNLLITTFKEKVIVKNRSLIAIIMIYLITSMIFSFPMTTIAQTSLIEAQAETDAISDANKDVNKLLWFGGGCLLSGLALIPTPGTFTSCLLPPAGIAATYFYKPAPPISRFVGKTSEYISVYTSTYKSKRGNIQAGMASAGCLTGGVLIGAGLTIVGLTIIDNIE